MANPSVERVDLPAGALITNGLSRIDYADAYRIKLPPSEFNDIDSIARSIFSATPDWARLLMAIRNRVVSVIGLKTSSGDAFDASSSEFKPGSSVGFFRVYERNDNEVVLGEDDSHLDFRVSALRVTEGEESWAILSTIVRFNNWVGRAYFVPVKPFHKLIVRAIMRRAIQARG